MIVEPDDKHRHSYVLSDSLRILVVDDDPILREFALVYLSTPTASVVTAEDGETGLRLLDEQTFDIVLTDLDMPGISGFEFITTLRSRPAFAHLPVIMVTSNDDVVSIDRAFEAGATSFVTKPINWRLLSYQVKFVHRANLSLTSHPAARTPPPTER